MSYRCDNCGSVSRHGVPANRVVTETRQHSHPFRKDANRDGSNDPGGDGPQIASEKTLCASCIAPE